MLFILNKIVIVYLLQGEQGTWKDTDQRHRWGGKCGWFLKAFLTMTMTRNLDFIPHF